MLFHPGTKIPSSFPPSVLGTLFGKGGISDIYHRYDLVAKVTVIGSHRILQSLPVHESLEVSVPPNDSVVYVEGKKINLGYNSALWMYMAVKEAAITRKLQDFLGRPEFRGNAFLLDDQHYLCEVLFLSYIPGQSFVNFMDPRWLHRNSGNKSSYLQTVGEVISKMTSDLTLIHANNVIHRDIALENIIVASGKVHTLIDYGLATFISPEDITEHLPQPGFQGLNTINWSELSIREYVPERKGFGRPYYAAPEVAVGEKGTPASDVFSLGIVFWEALMRESAFLDETFRTRANFRPESTADLLAKLASHPHLSEREKK